MGKKIDITGKRFGRLTALAICGKTPSKHTLWELICDCGNKAIAEIAHLKDGRRVSCGCAKVAGSQIKIKKAKHGHCCGNKSSKVYMIWSGMLTRCKNDKVESWHHYGGRGIKVCDRWQKFENFLADMGEPNNGLSIDRIDNNGDYTPENCRWATGIEQANNTRANAIWEHNGIKMTISEWARKIGMNRSTLQDRVRKTKWSIDKALTTPKQTPTEVAYNVNKARWGYERLL